MKRRAFLKVLSGAAALWPLVGRAQQTVSPVVGYLGSETPKLFESRLRAFQDGLSSVGFEDGRNVVIEYRWAQGHNGRLPALAAELVERNVAVIAAPGSLAAALAAKAATSVIPIVFETGADPVKTGLVPSLSKPAGNITGVSSLNAEVGPKRLELLRELMPQGKTFALLVNPTNPENAAATKKDLEGAAQALGLRLHVLNASTERDFDSVFLTLRELKAAGLVIANETFFANRSEQLAALAVRHAVPTVHQSREFVLAGGLMSYGGNVKQSHRQAGVYTGLILKGEKASDLPVQQVTILQLAINLKAAKALGLTVPMAMLGRADEVIE